MSCIYLETPCTWTLPENYNTVEHKGDGHTNCSWCTWNGPKTFGKKLDELEVKGRNGTTQNT